MTTPNVLTQALQMMGSGQAVNLSKLQTGAGDFDRVMSDSLGKRLDTAGKNTEAVKQSTSPGKQFNGKPVTEKAETVVSKETPSKEISPETAKEVEAAIKDMVKEELGLTDEELEAAMAVLGLEFLDLLQPENMKALLLQVNQADAMELLTNEDLASQLADLLQGTEEILAEKGLSVSPEELPELMDSLKEVLAQPEETEQPETENQPKVEVVVEKDGSKEPAKAVEEAEDTPETIQEGKTAVTEQPEEGIVKEELKSELSDMGNRQETRKGFGEETRENPMDVILQNLSKNVSPDKAAMTGAQRMEVMREIVNQVLEQIRIHIKPDSSSMEITLNPENLGRINLNVIAKDGHLTASFTAQNQVTKEALESQIQTLKENLNNQGLKVDAIEVNIESFAFDERNQQMNGGQENGAGQSKSRERKLSAADIARALGEETEVEEEALNTAAITQSGSNVDYTA